MNNEYYILLAIALINAYTAWISRKAHDAAKETQADMRKVEVATNSMKDALVAKTAEAAEAKGRDDQRVIEEAKAATLAEGNLAGKASNP